MSLFRALSTLSVRGKRKAYRDQSKDTRHLPTIKTDADKVSWVLNNFLTNAIKHSSKKAVLP